MDSTKPLALLVALILLSVLITLEPAPVKASGQRTITVPDDFSSIQAAIDDANAGDTVFVKSGTYDLSEGGRGRAVEGRLWVYTALTIDKPISLVGQNCSDTILLERLFQGTGGVSYGIIVKSDNVLISGFNVKSNEAAFVLEGDNITLTNTIIASTFIAVLTDGDNKISSNTIEDSAYGIMVTNGDAIISDNLIRYSDIGIVIKNSTGNQNIICNTIINNTIGISFSKSPRLFNHNTVANSSQYNVYLGTIYDGTLATENCYGTAENVDATDNYWGTTDSSAIGNSIYDHKNNSTLGTVTFSLFLTSPSSNSNFELIISIIGIIAIITVVVLTAILLKRRRQKSIIN